MSLIRTMSKCPFYLLRDKQGGDLSFPVKWALSRSIAGAILRKMLNRRQATQPFRDIIISADWVLVLLS